MKVILLQDVAKVGKRFEVANVPDGFALNKLIPQKVAEPATPAALKQLEKRSAQIASEKEADTEAFTKASAALAETTLTIPVEANELGHLFQAVKPEAIVEAAKEAGVSISTNQLIIPAPIKEVGSHTIALHSGDEESKVAIEVVSK